MKKVLSILCAIIMCFTQAVYAKEGYGVDKSLIIIQGLGQGNIAINSVSIIPSVIPEVRSINFESSSKLMVTSDYYGEVQYKVWLKKDNQWIDVLGDWSKPQNPKIPFAVEMPILKEGSYTTSVWIKRVGHATEYKSYDNYFATSFNAIKDTSNINFSDLIINDNYSAGEINIEGFNNEKYELTAYDILNNKIITPKDKLNLTEGNYILNISSKENSKKYIKKYVVIGDPDLDKYKHEDYLFKNTPNIQKLIEVDRFTVKNNKLHYNDEKYLPKETIIPNLNEKMFNLAKSYLDKNEKGTYCQIGYGQSLDKEVANIVGITATPTYQKLYMLWDISFYENKKGKLNEHMLIELRSLDEHANNRAIHEQRLKKDMQVIFGIQQGADISTFMLKEYDYIRTLNDKNSEDGNITVLHQSIKQFKNVKITAQYNKYHNLYFYICFN